MSSLAFFAFTPLIVDPYLDLKNRAIDVSSLKYRLLCFFAFNPVLYLRYETHAVDDPHVHTHALTAIVRLWPVTISHIGCLSIWPIVDFALDRLSLASVNTHTRR